MHLTAEIGEIKSSLSVSRADEPVKRSMSKSREVRDSMAPDELLGAVSH